MEYLDKRHNYKIFKPDIDVPKELEQRLDKIINQSPIQTNGFDVVKIFKCGINDKKIKEDISAFVFKNDSTNLVELAPITAPLVYFCFNQKNKHHDKQHANLIGGAMMVETLQYDYDFSFIACTTTQNVKTKQNYINEMMRERFNIHKKMKLGLPFMAFCIGRADHSIIGKGQYKMHNGIRINYTTIRGKMDKPQMLYE